jgi:hypothetical protein
MTVSHIKGSSQIEGFLEGRSEEDMFRRKRDEARGATKTV